MRDCYMPICESTCLRRVCRCFSFEALLQVLKHIAANCNYKDVSFRMAEFISYRAGLTLLNDRLTHVHDPMFQFSAEPITIERGVDDSLKVVDATRAIDDFMQQVRYTPRRAPRARPTALPARRLRAWRRARNPRATNPRDEDLSRGDLGELRVPPPVRC